jgi:CheY-like chemotaxis protein
MCLNGSLDDFSLQDILQILSLGRKTGHLAVRTPAGSATIIFQEGSILASVDDVAPPLATDLARLPGWGREEVIHRRIAASLARLSHFRQGEFSFQTAALPPRVIRDRDVALETLGEGIGVVELLLEVAWRQDEEARDPASVHALTPGAAATVGDRPASPAGSLVRQEDELSVLLVDDEELVRHILARYLVAGGYPVVEAADVESAVRRGASLGEAGVRFVLVTDLNMPASGGGSFRGGGEVVKRLARLRPRPPVVMMADCASVSMRAVPMRGVWSVVLKPGLSKLDPQEFEADLRALAGRMVEVVLPRVCSALSA